MDRNGQLSFLSKSKAALQRNPLTGVSWVKDTNISPDQHAGSAHAFWKLNSVGGKLLEYSVFVNVHKYDPATQAVTTQVGYLLTKPASTPNHSMLRLSCLTRES